MTSTACLSGPTYPVHTVAQVSCGVAQLASMLDYLLVGLDDCHVNHTTVLLCNGHQTVRANVASLSQ